MRSRIHPRWRVWSGIGLAAVGTLWAQPTLAGLLIGTLCVAMGAAWRIWSAGYIDKNVRLTTEGPYRWHRHPLYWGTFWIGLGFAAMIHRVWFWVALFVYFILVYGRTVREEETFLRERFGQAFEAYASHTPLWWPRPPVQRMDSPSRWSWTRVQRHREHRTLVAVTLWTALFWIRWSVG